MERLMTTAEVAAMTRVPEASLRYLRHIGTGGPASFKVGNKRVVYRASDVEAWIAQGEAAEEARRQPRVAGAE